MKNTGIEAAEAFMHNFGLTLGLRLLEFAAPDSVIGKLGALVPGLQSAMLASGIAGKALVEGAMKPRKKGTLRSDLIIAAKETKAEILKISKRFQESSGLDLVSGPLAALKVKDKENLDNYLKAIAASVDNIFVNMTDGADSAEKSTGKLLDNLKRIYDFGRFKVFAIGTNLRALAGHRGGIPQTQRATSPERSRRSEAFKIKKMFPDRSPWFIDPETELRGFEREKLDLTREPHKLDSEVLYFLERALDSLGQTNEVLGDIRDRNTGI
jgi:hypothetical protein